MTPHIDAKLGEIAKVVLMPGDPLRAAFIAKTYLRDAKEVSNVRNMSMFTGYYNNTRVTVAGSGMGMPSMGIYSYELFAFYGVEVIIRIGSSGSYLPNLKVRDVVLATAAYSHSTYALDAIKDASTVFYPSPEINALIVAASQELAYPLRLERIESEDVFYNAHPLAERIARSQAACVEMESFALFVNAQRLGKKAACLLTISDNLVTHEVTTPRERQESFTKMMEIALCAVEKV